MTKLEMQELAKTATVMITKVDAGKAKGLKKERRVTKAHIKRVDAIVSRYIPNAA